METRDFDNYIDELIEAPCYVIDFLPKQVPADRGGRFFAVESHLMKTENISNLYEKFSSIIIKLNCYHDVALDDGTGWIENPEPDELIGAFERCYKRGYANFLFPKEHALIALSGADLYMSLYNPSEEFRKMTALIAASEGLFVRKS